MCKLGNYNDGKQIKTIQLEDKNHTFVTKLYLKSKVKI